MKKDGYYSSGEFARMAHVTLRTVRYYDKQDILKPSLVTESGARFYTDEILQGFSRSSFWNTWAFPWMTSVK